MKKIVIFLIGFLFIINVKAIDITSNYAIMYNLNDNSVIYEKNSTEKVQIASLTKIVTAITILDNNTNINDKVIITKDMLYDLNGYAKLGLSINDEVTVEELLYALMLPSAADSAQALAIYKSGSIEDFTNLMNEEVTKIGVSDSHFDNPVGRDSGNNYSTASDVAIILKYALNNDIFKKIFETNTYHIESLNKTIKKTLTTTSTNYNINTNIIKGAKTGYTDLAGLCLASTSILNDVNYLIVVLNSPITYPYQLVDTLNLYNYFNDNYSYKIVLNKDIVLNKIKIKYGKKSYYEIVSKKEIKLYLNNNIDLSKITYEYDGINEINKKIKLNDKLGIINIKYDDEILYSFEVFLNEEIEYHNFWLYGFITIVILSILFLLIKKLRNKS